MLGNLLDLPAVRFVVVGGLVYGLAVAMLALLEKFRVQKSWASLVVLVVTLQVSFLLNNHWAFSSLPASNLTEVGWRWVQYIGARAVPTVFEQAGFVYLDRKRVPYILASFIVVSLGFVFVYVLSAVFIFVER